MIYRQQIYFFLSNSNSHYRCSHRYFIASLLTILPVIVIVAVVLVVLLIKPKRTITQGKVMRDSTTKESTKRNPNKNLLMRSF